MDGKAAAVERLNDELSARLNVRSRSLCLYKWIVTMTERAKLKKLSISALMRNVHCAP